MRHLKGMVAVSCECVKVGSWSYGRVAKLAMLYSLKVGIKGSSPFTSTM